MDRCECKRADPCSDHGCKFIEGSEEVKIMVPTFILKCFLVACMYLVWCTKYLLVYLLFIFVCVSVYFVVCEYLVVCVPGGLCVLGMFRNHFLSPIDPRLSPDFAFGATDTTKKISSPNSIGKQWLRPRPFFCLLLIQVKCRKTNFKH